VNVEPLETLAERAKQGDRDALDALVRGIADFVYGLALRMLWHPADAEDATQEILTKVVTNLASFRGDSAFKTWAYRVASNHLLTGRKRRLEQQRDWAFEHFGDAIAEGLADPGQIDGTAAEQKLFAEEVKIGCTQGMLLCLDREHRLAYILGEVFALDGPEGAEVAGIEPAAFRKRLSRAREQIRAFMQANCGIVNPANPCRCARQVQPLVRKGIVDPKNLLFAVHPAVREQVAELDRLDAEAAVFRSHPRYQVPSATLAAIKALITSGRYTLLDA
jgi:RNA polymerase sigma factor (sigma-70 family)